ncbi:hypothetical protein R5R35_001439 [Gryllus longicercus]|uniref:Cation-dependent mannose-6-phosphate receptor n=2 Tax=Gryllus longicercus TaxID=2509291 RepID=A0AAN9VJY9_9ORTH
MSLLDERSAQNVTCQLINFAVMCIVMGLFSSQCYALSAQYTSFRCKRVDSCVCMFENEEGYDLSELSAVKNGLNATKSNLTFYFHPCTDISIGNNTDLNDCYKGVSVCLYNSTDQTYTNLGLSHEVRVTSSGLKGPVAFVYSHNNSTTTVMMNNCADSNSLQVGSGNGANNYELLLNSPSACRQRVYVKTEPPDQPQGHLSTGSVLVIMFIVFSSLYFVGGALVLKLLRGAEGREMIPNYDFWVSLPGLVKEGFLFTLSGCRTAQAYDRI